MKERGFRGQGSGVRGAVGLALACLLLAGCGTGTAEEAASGSMADHVGHVHVPLLRIAWADVGVPTPFRVSTAGPGGAALLSLMYDTLTWKDSHGIIPWLATSWDVSADGRTYTFTLAPSVRWQDGQPLTSADVAFSFAYYAQHPYRWMSSNVVAAAQALDGTHVAVQLRQPYAPFLEDVAGSLPIIPEHVWASVSDPNTYDGPDATTGSGPFKLAEYQPATGNYRLVANLDYFRGSVHASEIQQLNVPNETRLQAFRQGDVDLVLATDASAESMVANQPRLKSYETEPLSVVRLAINTDSPPLNQLAVRQAIAYALDRQRIAELMTRAPAITGGAGAIPPESPWFNTNLPSVPFDLAKAQEALGGQQINLELLADPSAREPELMQPMLEAAGIHLTVRRADAKTRSELLREGKFQLALTSHIGVGGDPDFLRRWYSGEETNDFAQGSVFHDPAFAQLGASEATTLDQAARKTIVDDMQATIAAQLPTIVLYYRRFYWLYDSTRFTPMDTWGGLMNGMPLPYNKMTFLQLPGSAR